MNTIVTTNQKPAIDTKKPETKEHRYTTKKIIKPQRKKLKKNKNKELQKQWDIKQ